MRHRLGITVVLHLPQAVACGDSQATLKGYRSGCTRSTPILEDHPQVVEHSKSYTLWRA